MINIALQTFSEALVGKSGCLFCSPFNGMLIRRTKNFNLLADTFPVMPGHVMISSRDHYGCAGEIPLELQFELNTIKGDVASSMRKKYGKAIFYEHGRAGCCMALNPDGSRCEHFHLHALPVDIDISKYLEKNFDVIKMLEYNSIFENFYSYGNYLFFENNFGDKYFYVADGAIVDAHLLRTLVCRELMVSERSNWQQYTDKALWLESYKAIKEEFVAQGFTHDIS